MTAMSDAELLDSLSVALAPKRTGPNAKEMEGLHLALATRIDGRTAESKSGTSAPRIGKIAPVLPSWPPGASLPPQ
jgi:hypothetical protein